MLASKGLMASSAVEPIYVDDVFSTYLYTGNGSTQTITNGIDLAGEGGLVWQKIRSSTGSHILVDTARGAGNFLNSNSTSAQTFNASVVSSFNSDGFTDGGSQINGATYASWTFRKAPKFFDIVTYTGNGVAGRTVAHNLGSVPGMIIVKRTDSASSWYALHRSVNMLTLNSTSAAFDAATTAYYFGDDVSVIRPTSTNFTVGSAASNTNGGTYVAYIFAHDAGGFGESGTDNIVSCGSYTAPSGTLEVNIGFEPQFLLIKNVSSSTNWMMADIMRGMSLSSATVALSPNLNGAENTDAFPQVRVFPTPTGFFLPSGGSEWGNGDTFIYLAIRRPNKPPTIGTQVFSPVTQTGGGTVTTNFSVDLAISAMRSSGNNIYVLDRLRGSTVANSATLNTDNTNAEGASGGGFGFDNNTGYKDALWGSSSLMYWNFRRAPGFFDVVCYTGTGAARTVAHNLTVAPELIITKERSGTSDWVSYCSLLSIPNSRMLFLNLNNAEYTFNNFWTTPTASVFGFDTGGSGVWWGNESGDTYVAYLFATLAGISKVGSYTGTGTTLQINCGFTTGARFVMIKRTDSTGDWYVWDTARGIIAGDDPYLLLNSTAAEVTNTDYVDPLASGFEISSTAPAAINASGGSYIFLAIA